MFSFSCLPGMGSKISGDPNVSRSVIHSEQTRQILICSCFKSLLHQIWFTLSGFSRPVFQWFTPPVRPCPCWPSFDFEQGPISRKVDQN